MRVLYLHQYFVTPSMTGGTRSFEFAQRLVTAGHEVDVITANTARGGAQSSQPENIDGIRVHWLPVAYSNKMSYAARIAAFIKFAILAARRARRIGGDVVFATSTPLTIAIPGVLASRSLKIPMVFEVRDLWPEMPIAMGALRDPFSRYLARALERFAYRNSSHIIALSPGMARGVAETGYPREQITIIPNGCDNELLRFNTDARERFLSKHPYLGSDPLVVYGGTLGRINGVGYLVDIAHASHDLGLGVKFLIVGDGYERRSIEDRARQLGVLGKNIWLIPPVSKTEMAAVLSAACLATSLVIDLPELWKNSANKFFDALASGTPVAINHPGWQADLLNKTGAGIVLPADNAHEAARQIAELVYDEAKLIAAATAAKQLATGVFDRGRLAADFINILKDVADGAAVRVPARDFDYAGDRFK